MIDTEKMKMDVSNGDMFQIQRNYQDLCEAVDELVSAIIIIVNAVDLEKVLDHVPYVVTEIINGEFGEEDDSEFMDSL